MDLFRDSTFFTFLHCVLALSLPLAPLSQNAGSFIPEKGILQTPPYFNNDLQTVISKALSYVNPSWHNRYSSDMPILDGKDEAENSRPSCKPELPGTLKGIGLKYPRTSRVKLNFHGTTGMLPVNIIRNIPEVLKPTGPGVTTKSKPDQHVNPAKIDNPTTPRRQSGQLLLNNLQYTPAQPEMPGSFLNPTNFDYPPTNPDLYRAKDTRPENIQKYTPSYGTYVPEIAVSTLSSSQDRLHHGSDQPVDDIQNPAPYKVNLPIGVLKPTNIDYLTKPVGKVETAVELPPVPTTMSLLRRTQLVLLNTVAGLPGGNPQALEAIRAG